MMSKQVLTSVDLLRDDDGISSKKEDSDAVLSRASKKASRSKGLRSQRRLIGIYIGVDQG